MKGHGEKLSRKREQAIAALLVHPTLGQAAQAIGIGEASLWRWLQDNDFQAEYQQARRQVVSQAIGQLQQATGEAVQCLRDIMGNPDAPGHARVSSAKTVLEVAIKSVEIEDLERRIRDLEKLLKEGTGDVKKASGKT